MPATTIPWALGFVIIFTLIPRASAQDTPPIELRGFDPDTTTVSEVLDLVLDVKLNYRAAEYTVRWAAKTGDPSYIPRLKQIARQESGNGASVTLNALYALWELGEPLSYFRDNASAWEQDLYLSVFSIHMMARTPDSTTFADLATLIESIAPSDGEAERLMWATIHNQYQWTLSLQAEYDTVSVAQRLRMIYRGVEGALFVKSVVDGKLIMYEGLADGDLEPWTLWARDRLKELAQRDPEAAQQFIDGISERSSFIKHFRDEAGPVGLGFEQYLTDIIFPDGFPPPRSSILPDLPGALTLASAFASSAFAGDVFQINGFDHTLGGSPSGSGDDVHGVFTTTTAAQQGFAAGIQAYQRDNIIGTGSNEADVAQGALAFDAAALIDSLLTRVDQTLSIAPTGTLTLGSQDAPVIVHAPQGLQTSATITGTGILIVDGAFFVSGTLDWTGLVIHRGTPFVGPALSVSTSLHVTGGMLVYNEGPFAASTQVSNDLTLRYSREVFEMLRDTLDLPTQ